MLCKLAFRNVRKSIGDYTVYFITLMFAVMFFYAFNSLDAQQAVMDLNENKETAAQMMLQSIEVFSVFVAVALAILILYANNFLIKRRNKELGIYLIPVSYTHLPPWLNESNQPAYASDRDQHRLRGY